jgi:uncharacterized protein (TIGR02270 family)
MALSDAAEPLWGLVEESLGEATFLWRRWEAELTSLTRNLDEVWLWTEDRLHGALEGVRVGGDLLLERVFPETLSSEDLRGATVCAYLMAAGEPARARALLASVVKSAAGPRLGALLRGIEVADLDSSFFPVAAALAQAGPEHAAALCRLKAFRRARPGPEAAVAFESKLPALQADALRAAVLGPGPEFLRYIETGIASDDPALRHVAIRCGLRRQLPAAWTTAQALVRERRPDAGPALVLLAMLGSPADHALISAALREPALQRAGLFALGFVGTREAAELCLAGMRDPKLARSAGEAYCAITGADLQRDRLSGAESPDADAMPAFEQEDLDASLLPPPDSSWPIPELPAVRRHWEAVASRFAPGTRYVRGEPVSVPTLLKAMESGPMLRRPDIGFELCVRTRGQYDVETRDFRAAQRRMLAAARVVASTPVR